MSNGLIPLLLDTLQLGDAARSDLPARWRVASCRGLSELIAYEGAGLWLYRRLRATGALESLPEPVADELRQRAFATAGMGMRIEEAAADAHQVLFRAGIPVVLIKGMARRALAGRYPYLDARPTSDVDLLVEESRVREAFDRLRAAGYAEVKKDADIQHHLPTLWNEHRVGIELHFSTSRWTAPAVAWQRATSGGLEVEWMGQTVRTPSPTELAWHAAHHAIALGNSIVLGFRLQHFLEAAALAAGGADIAWNLLGERAERERPIDPETEEALPPQVMHQWLSAAQSLGGAARNPEAPHVFDLAGLLRWRLAVQRARARLGASLVEHFLEEGPRALVGAPLEGSAPGVSWPKLLRRRTAAIGSRAIFRVWRAAGS